MGQVDRAARGVVEDLQKLVSEYNYLELSVPTCRLKEILDWYEEQIT